MAYFAELDSNNIVTRVLAVNNKDTSDDQGNEKEEIGIAFLKGLFGDDTVWLQTSYNNRIRVRYASIGYSYNKELDAFIVPKPFDSWVLNVNTADWESPIGPAPARTEEMIAARRFFRWEETTQAWVDEPETPLQ